MNAETGQIYRLETSDTAIGGLLPLLKREYVESEEATDDVRAAYSAQMRGEPIVRVSEKAAQLNRLGERELRRRKQRRRK
jgi:hypothetical protein